MTAGGDENRRPPASPDTPQVVLRAAASLARRTSAHDKTEAVLLADSAVIHDPDFSAEPDGRLRSRQLRVGRLPAAGVGLKPPLAQATVMDHAEAQAAAVLRRRGSPEEAVLVLNHTPCDDPIRPLVCEKILATILPEGTRLTVFLTDGDRTWLHKLYIGTGEGIRR
ncbi:DddA-like double-stranded DNA deaminase toxin [Micromonospora sp. NPDC005203]|uniref:DddA-like double-stranded DNA deaminase toxin n=1 Tax=Micromonospora sp. NPDC005203 TaxID=3364226 RepID=UPI00367E2D19